MKRPKQHVIDTRAQSLFRQSLPAEWAVRPIDPDYRIDYEVELVGGGSLTGFTFYAQLKGTQSPRYRDVSLCLPFEVDKLSYYSERVNRPVIILTAYSKSSNGGCAKDAKSSLHGLRLGIETRVAERTAC